MQKPLNKGKKATAKAKAANRHGKITKHRKGVRKLVVNLYKHTVNQSGKVTAPPKAAAEKAKFEENKELTKFINERNLTTIAGVAAQAGSKLKLVQAPPVAATAQQKRK